MKLASFEAIVRALDAAGVRYLVVGGLAVIAHGYGRATYDVDLDRPGASEHPRGLRGAPGH